MLTVVRLSFLFWPLFAQPFKPPDIVMLTPSGRFEINKKICLSISSFHPKNWQPSWSIRTVLTALIAFFPTPGAGAIGSLEYSSHERKEYARRSTAFRCELCEKTNEELLPDLPPGVLERAGGPPKLAQEVQATLDANKHIAATVPSSTPSTPAHGPVSVPATPVNVAQAQRIMAEAGPSQPTSPLFVRSHSEPMGHTQHQQQQQQQGGGEQPVGAPVAATAAAASSSSSLLPSGASPSLAPLVLDEGLRQRQGRVVVPTEEAKGQPAGATAAAAAVAAPPPAAAAVAQQPAVAVQPLAAQRPPPPAADNNQLSIVTVFLAFLIVLILMRKLYASSQAKAAFTYEFSQE